MVPFEIACTNCHRKYPDQGLPYCCPVCGGVYDYSKRWAFDPRLVDEKQPGIWRYRVGFGLDANAEPVSMGEGGTPLLWAEVFGRQVAFKCEYQNPTGSFKDRGSALLVGWMKARGIREVVEDSSGNAGASLAAYCQRAGIKARIFIPASAAGPKRRQIEALGAELVPVDGRRSDVAEAVKREAEKGVVYASHAYLPYNLPGYATAAYEIHAQMGYQMPGTVIVPAGQGGLLLGLRRGFDTLRIAASLGEDHNGKERQPDMPVVIGVQARACAPLWAAAQAGLEGLGFVTENQTLAEGVKVRHPVRLEAILYALSCANTGTSSRGLIPMCAVDEQDIIPGRDALARLGFYVEPTSALVWSALKQVLADAHDPIVLMLTGSGTKYE
jgi:threonine synthase